MKKVGFITFFFDELTVIYAPKVDVLPGPQKAVKFMISRFELHISKRGYMANLYQNGGPGGCARLPNGEMIKAQDLTPCGRGVRLGHLGVCMVACDESL